MLGNLLGALPGAGADIAAWVCYALSKRLSRTPEKFGTGHPEGIADAGAANNAAVAGAWTPALIFGISRRHGDRDRDRRADAQGHHAQPAGLSSPTAPLVYAVFTTFILANLVMIPAGMLAIRSARYALAVPQRILMPMILLFCMIGSYAGRQHGVPRSG